MDKEVLKAATNRRRSLRPGRDRVLKVLRLARLLLATPIQKDFKPVGTPALVSCLCFA
jgi:hypothetical protein